VRAWLGRHADVIFLVVVMLVLFGAVLIHSGSETNTVRQQDLETRHDFCGIVSAFISKPVPRPADPAANPSREQAYLLYLKFVRLSDNLGCG
jgi:hypothetical protein